MKPYDTEQDKKEQVREMFDRIAPAYDRLNHTLSFQIDKLWRRHVVRIVRRMQPRRILDVATGTGDLALAMARRMRGVQVLGVDLSENMLAEARRKATACGLDERVVLSLGDAERLEVADASVDVVTVAASPYGGWEEIEQACRKISALQGPLVVMDCIGYSFAMKREVAEKTGKTVVLSRTMAARVISELSDI
mgnify:CR=1 FL=1